MNNFYSMTDKVASNQNSLESVLERCQSAADKGYALASENIRETQKAVREAEDKIGYALAEVQGLNIRAPEITEQIRVQLAEVVSQLRTLQVEAERRLEEKRHHLRYFNVSLFGRTMAGKSTLMEILTNGDGRTIGKGAQRTTQDVRDYTWRGLRITDVPGVAAFEGQEDEESAFRAAEQADLVLFLITNDGPQDAEAECLARIKHLGKPVLGVCNVKAACEKPDDLELFLLDPDRYFDNQELASLRDQFIELVEQHSPGIEVKFVFSHLHARFLAEQTEMKAKREELLKVSRFDQVEKAIVQRITESGEFDRFKTFIDASVVPMSDLANSLLNFREKNSSAGRTYKQKRDQFNQWLDDFRNVNEDKIRNSISRATSTLRSDIPDFAEDHYADSRAGNAWQKHVENQGITEKASKVLNTIADQAKTSVDQFVRELDSELLLANSFQTKNISMPSILDIRWAARWSTALVTGALTVAAVIIGATTPVGWALDVAAISVMGLGLLFEFFTDSRAKKAADARRKLETKLEENVSSLEKRLSKQMLDWFYNQLLKKQLYPIKVKLQLMISSLFRLADAQRDLADLLIEREQHLNNVLIKEALQFLGFSKWGKNIHRVARIPGYATVLLLEPGVRLPNSFRRELGRLLEEEILYVIDTGNKRSLITQLLKRSLGSRVQVSIEEKIRVAHVPMAQLDDNGLRLAMLSQQLTGLHVMA